MSNIAKTELDNDAPGFLRRMYANESARLALELAHTDSITHDGTKGTVGEEHWITLLRNYLPRRFRVRSGIVMDSRGQTSDQIDVIIHDAHFTPQLLTQGSHGYVLAEAVYAVFEVKQSLNKETLEYAADKARSVRVLHRTSAPTISSGRCQEPRALFPVVAGILARDTGWQDGVRGQVFDDNLAALVDDMRVDCGCALRAGSFDGFARLPMDVDRALTHAPLMRASADVGVVYFLFRLLGWLNQVGTVPAVDWNAYAEVLRGRDEGT